MVFTVLYKSIKLNMNFRNAFVLLKNKSREVEYMCLTIARLLPVVNSNRKTELFADLKIDTCQINPNANKLLRLIENDFK